MKYKLQFTDRWMKEEDVKDGILYILKNPDITNVFFRCPCSQQDYVMLPIFPKGKGVGWNIEINAEKATINPSILRSKCNSHYFIKSNEVKWC